MDSSEDQHDNEEMTEDEALKKAKQLLQLTDLVERYPSVIERRVGGIIYLIISGGIALSYAAVTTVMDFLMEIGGNLLIAFVVMGLSLFVAWGAAFRLVVPLTKSYPKTREDGVSPLTKVVWGPVIVAIVLATVFLSGSDNQVYLPFVLQVLITIGNVGNYVDFRRTSQEKPFMRAQLVFVLLLAISTIPMLLFPSIGYAVILLVDVGGIFVQGIYMLISAENLLLETKGRD